MLLAHVHQNSTNFPKTVNKMYFISVATESVISSLISIFALSPAVVGCITGLKWLLTGQISWLKKTMI